jgi:hypothetical protein
MNFDIVYGYLDLDIDIDIVNLIIWTWECKLIKGGLNPDRGRVGVLHVVWIYLARIA